MYKVTVKVTVVKDILLDVDRARDIDNALDGAISENAIIKVNEDDGELFDIDYDVMKYSRVDDD